MPCAIARPRQISSHQVGACPLPSPPTPTPPPHPGRPHLHLVQPRIHQVDAIMEGTRRSQREARTPCQAVQWKRRGN